MKKFMGLVAFSAILAIGAVVFGSNDVAEFQSQDAGIFGCRSQSLVVRPQRVIVPRVRQRVVVAPSAIVVPQQLVAPLVVQPQAVIVPQQQLIVPQVQSQLLFVR